MCGCIGVRELGCDGRFPVDVNNPAWCDVVLLLCQWIGGGATSREDDDRTVSSVAPDGDN